MNNKILIFLAGAAIGSIATWAITKTKFERILDEELNAMEEYYLRKLDEKEEEPWEESPTDEDLSEYENIVKEEGYTNEEGGHVMSNKPYVIPPEEYGEADGYDAVSLNYFADGVITDDWNEPLEDVAGTVGLDIESHFGEYEDDCVFIRNDALKTDFEILRDLRKFSELDDEE